MEQNGEASVFDPHGRDATLAGMAYLCAGDDLSSARLFQVLLSMQSGMRLRDLEPVLGYWMRHADPESDVSVFRRRASYAQETRQWAEVQRAEYLLELLCYFSPQKAVWQKVLFPWLDDLAKSLPGELPLLSFFPGGERVNGSDSLASRWHLSSGVLYDRLLKLLRPPYVC